jgi:hypothetical protein
MHQTLQRVVDVFSEKLNYVYCDIGPMPSALVNLGFSGSREPVYIIGSMMKEQLQNRYLFPEDRPASPESVIRWVYQFLDTTDELVVRSKAQALHPRRPYCQLFGFEFRESFMDPRFDVVVVLLLPDENNRSLALETGRKAAVELQRQNVASVKFYYIDAVFNELPEFAIDDRWGSTIMFWPAGENKTPLILPGNIGFVGLLETIARQGRSKAKIKVPFDDDGTGTL